METLRILIIDDNVARADGMRELLELAGLETHVAYTGNDGLQCAIDLLPDALLLDVNLPDMSGQSLCLKVRALTQFERIAVVFHTAERSYGVVYDDTGADSFLVYPFTSTEAIAVIRGTVAKRRRTQGQLSYGSLGSMRPNEKW